MQNEFVYLQNLKIQTCFVSGHAQHCKLRQAQIAGRSVVSTPLHKTLSFFQGLFDNNFIFSFHEIEI